MNSIEKIKKALGPCGLNCEKCFANADGGIKYHSRKLQDEAACLETWPKTGSGANRWEKGSFPDGAFAAKWDGQPL